MYDNHNWGAITVDGKGYLHVVINGHHNPAAYSRTVRPLDISEWTPTQYVLPEDQKLQPNLSYATLNCDKKNNLYTVHRSTTGGLQQSYRALSHDPGRQMAAGKNSDRTFQIYVQGMGQQDDV